MIHEILPSGVEVVVKENHFTPVVAIQVWVGVGSMHEASDERGMAHFLEHMLFKGTARRGVGEIASTVEACGGEINAYTTFDQTVFHLTLGAAYADLGVDLLFDAFAFSLLDESEVEREREVILEEIRRSNDSPGSILGRRVFELMFEGSEAGRPIIGSEQSVSGFTREQLVDFYKKWYRANNCKVVVTGSFDGAAMLAQLESTFGSLIVESSAQDLAQPRAPMRPVPSKDWPKVSLIKGDYQQPRLAVVYPAPSLEHLDSTALDVAAFALGAGEMSRLNRRLRDEEGLVSSISASVYSPFFGGIFEISALVSPDSLAASIAGIAREVSLISNVEPVTGDELSRTRANLRSDRIYQEETVDGQARALGFGLRTSQKLLYDDVYMAMINHMPETAVQGAARRWLKPEDAAIVALIPNDMEGDESDLRAQFRAGVLAGRRGSPYGLSSLINKRPDIGTKQAEIIQINDGLKLIHRSNPHVELFTLTAATEGGLRAESSVTAGLYNAMFSLVGMASKERSFESLVTQVEGLGASLEGFSGKDSAGIHMQCLSEQTDQMLRLFREAFLSPVFPEQQWISTKREIMQSLIAQTDSPSSICVRKFQERLFGEHPYRNPVTGTLETVAKFQLTDLADTYESVVGSGPWVIAVASNLSTAEVEALISEALDGFTPQASRRQFNTSDKLGTSAFGSESICKAREQVHLAYGFRGLTWDDPDRAALDVLTTVLGGHGGRLFRELRDRQSLAYSVSPLVSYGCDPGLVGAYIACAPEKRERAMEALRLEFENLVSRPPSSTEIERAISYIVGSHEMGLQKSDAQTSTMALMELYGFGYDDFLVYPRAVGRVTASDVQRVATRLFVANKSVDVTVGPDQ
ncbi:MAG: insulinase family protein [Deltaproteobacteria bacterium]|nr:insulinase family protein [Deltaproteobacteria bacterium]